MLDQLVLWNYASVWKPALGASIRPIYGTRSTDGLPDDIMVEQQAFDRVMDKVRATAPMSLWARTQSCGLC